MKNKIKKIIGVILISGFLCVSLTACGEDNVVFHYDGPVSFLADS